MILETRNLRKYFPTRAGFLKKSAPDIKAIDKIDIQLRQGQTLGIVGETGCGKTTLAKLLVGLYKPTSGEIYYRGQNLAALKACEKKAIKKDIQMVFQDPYSSLDPRMKIKDTLSEGIIIHNIVKKSGIEIRLNTLMDMVELPRASLSRYPHEFSGGERQRIAIARALSTEPEIIIYDEPVSSLDVSIQAKILRLLLNLQKKLNLSYIFISHDILIVKAISDRIAVMFSGKIIEEAPTKEICERPVEEYTKQLMSAAAYGKTGTATD